MMRYAIGLDIGGTKIEGCVVSSNGKVIDRHRIPTEAKKGKAVVIRNILSVISELLHRNRKIEVTGIGAGIPGFTDRNGQIVLMPNAPLKGTNLAEVIRKRFGMPAFVDNDANCFALAEYMFGAGKGSSVMLGLIVGTGVGGGIILDGRTLPGCEGGAGEIGHILLDHSAKSMVVGKNDFESACSGPGLTRRYVKAGGKIKDPDPKKIFASNDPVARKVVDDEYRYLGILLGGFTNTLNPDMIVLGGGVSNVISPARIEKDIKKFAIPFSASKVKVRRHSIGDSAGVLGAAALVFSGLK
ncbi:ROK family protein [Candidatus Woesearchaeota archaeon]|nr:ROK family protein [Candidatus Woesearchaeota archaeon]